MRKEKWMILPLLLASPLAIAAEDLNSKVDELSERLTELEVSQRLQKFRLSGTVLNYFEDFRSETDRVTPFGMYVGLNADFDISKNLKFYSTLGMSKFFNNEGRNEALDSNSDGGLATYVATETGAWAYGGAGVKFDRAFLSYEADGAPLTLAIGRMPTNMGPPIHQMDGLTRQGTYPRFTFNAIFDGMAAVYNFSSLLPKDHTFKVRGFYQPFVFVDTYDRTKQLLDGVRFSSLSNQVVVIGEYSIKKLRFADELGLTYMYASWSDFYNGIYDGLAPAAEGDEPSGTDEKGSDQGIFASIENLGHFGLNISWSSLLYTATTRAEPDYTKRAWGHLLNVNQRLPFLGDSILGLELIHTDVGFYLDDWTRMYLIPFYNKQNSNGQHVFLTVPLSDRASVRAGYYNIRAGVGDDYQPDPMTARSFYAMLRVDF